MSTMADEISEQTYRAREEYNGWANRETWAFNLHWQNDRGLYEATLEVARGHLREDMSDRELGERVVNYWEDVLAEDPPTANVRPTLYMFQREVGSWWRIDHAEVGAAVRESLDTED